MSETIGKQEDNKAMKEARRIWKMAHPGLTGDIHSIVERSYDAGFIDGMERGQEKRGCCHE